MKFITEGDLRDLYNKEPFTAFDLESEARLTPGARQFLLDRKIKILGSDSGHEKKNISTNGNVSAEPSAAVAESKNNWKIMKLYTKLKSIEAVFFLTGEELLRKDVCLAQKTVQLNKQFSSIKNDLRNKCTVENLPCVECSEIDLNNFSTHIDDCFEITEFHIQLE
ncbi:MAG TPA: ethanolamine utilization protein, partial [Bacillota bacterium]|nr:ethanolamine utilization protein [Bacillota bacterium]